MPCTLRASLSGTFLQTLPDLVTPLFISSQLSTDAVSALRKVWVPIKFQALVYDILPSTTAVFNYATGSRKLAANEQFFVGPQTVVSLLQTTQIISDVCFITDHVAYASSNKTKSFESRRNSSFFYPGWMRLMFTCVFRGGGGGGSEPILKRQGR